MATPVHIGTQSSVSAGSSLTTNSASATAGNTLILVVSWIIASGVSGSLTPNNIAGWALDVGPSSSFQITTGNGAAGIAYYSKIATGGVESPVFTAPGSNPDLYAHGIIYEYTGALTFDATATASALITNNIGGASIGTTIPNSGTLAHANSSVLAGLALLAGSGLANANLAFSGGGYTTDATDNNTSTSVGTLLGHKSVTVTTAVNAVLTWTTDPTILCFQAGLAIYSDPGGTAVTGTGALTSPSSQISGSGTRHIAGAGALTSPSATIAGAGKRGIVDVGGPVALNSPGPTLIVGTASRGVHGTGALTSPSSQLSGSGSAGHQAVTGTGALSSPSSLISGAGVRHVSSTGALTSPSSQVAGSAVRGLPGTGTLTSPSSQMAGSGVVVPVGGIVGSGAPVSPSSQISGAGARGVPGVGALLSPSPTLIAGIATRGIHGTGALISPSSMIAGTGFSGKHITGTGALVSPSSRINGTNIPSKGGVGANHNTILDGIGIW